MTRVVVSVGTDHHPFDRLIEWISAIQEKLAIDVVVQRGATGAKQGVDSVDYVTAPELAALMQTADAVVCHGGPGTISMAQRAGHRPIVVARDPSLGEHVDDHQMRYAAKLAREGTIEVADSVDELARLLAEPRPVLDAVDHDAAIAEAVGLFASLVDRLLIGELPKRRWRNRFLVRRLP